jgi:hypothetical protein
MGWSMSTDVPQPLLTALYMRDIAALSPDVEPAIAPLVPKVESTEKISSKVRLKASAQWGRFWQLLLDGDAFTWHREYKPPGFSGLNDSAELQGLARMHYSAGWRWSEPRRNEFFNMASGPATRDQVEVDLINEAEQERGHPASHFRLDTRILPIEGIQGWRLADARVLVTSGLYLDPFAYREWMRPIIRELVNTERAEPLAEQRMPTDNHTERVELTEKERRLIFKFARAHIPLPEGTLKSILSDHSRSDCRLYYSKEADGKEVAYLMCTPEQVN